MMKHALSYFGSRQDRATSKVKKQARPALFETLEPRLLLSADAVPLSFDMEAEGVNKIHVRRDADTLHIINTETGSTIASQLLANTSNIAIAGSSLNDYVVIDYSEPFSLAGGISFTDLSSSDSDNLQIVGAATNWNINGTDSGIVGEVSFSQVENLTGGNLTDVFTLNGTISGSVEGGAGNDEFYLATGATAGQLSGNEGNDTLAGADTDNIWNITGQGSGTVAGVSFSNMENLSGGSGTDDFVFSDAAGVAGTVDGGGGVDNLIGYSSDSTWSITGENAGLVNDQAFIDFENLMGSADNLDTFIFDAIGSITGLIDGGVGGYDSLIIEGGVYETVTFTATGSDKGYISLDNTLITYAGLEPITLGGNADNVVIDLGQLDVIIPPPSPGDPSIVIPSVDVATLINNVAIDNQITLRSDNGTFETTHFNNPLNSLTIKLGEGNDYLEVGALDSSFNASLTVSGGGGSDDQVIFTQDLNLSGKDISIDAETISSNAGVDLVTGGGNIDFNNTGNNGDNVTIRGDIYTDGGDLNINAKSILIDTESNAVVLSTRNVAQGTDHATASSTGDSGSITFDDATSITVGSKLNSTGSANLFSHVEDNSLFMAGDITLSAHETVLSGVDDILSNIDIGFLNIDTSIVDIDLNDANIKGGIVTLNAEADHTQVFRTDDETFLKSILLESIGFLEQLSIIAGVTLSTADARIDIGENTSIQADSVDAISTATSAIAIAPKLAKGLSAAVGIMDTTAEVIVDGNITTTGDVYIASHADNTFDITAEADGLSGAAAAVAVSVLDSESTAWITDNATVNAGGDLVVRADTIDRNFTQASSTSGEDGFVGVAVAVSDEEGYTNAFVDGTVTAQGNITIQAFQENEVITDSKFFGLLPTTKSGVSANAGVNTDKSGDLVDQFESTAKDDVIAKIKDALKKKSDELQQEDKKTKNQVNAFDAAAGVAILADKNNVTARIGDASAINSADVLANGAITVNARTESRPDITAGSSIDEASSDGTTSPTTFAGSAAVAVGDYSNNARAYIDSNAEVDARDNLTVKAEALNDYEFSYGLNLWDSLSEEPDYTTDDNAIIIETGDIVEVSDEHTAGGEAGHFYQYQGSKPGSTLNLALEDFTDTDNWNDLGAAWQYRSGNFVDTLTSYLDDNLGLDNNLVDSWSQSTAAGAQFVLAGAVSVLSLQNTSEAYIAEDAVINQDISLRSGNQDVSIEALSVNEAVHFGGNIELPGISLGDENKKYKIDVSGLGSGTDASDGKAAIGGTVLIIDYIDDVSAEIRDGAQLFADSLLVDADTAAMSISVSAAGTDAGSFGMGGTYSQINIDNSTQARIDNGVDIALGNNLVGDSGASVVVDATDLTQIFNVAGGILSSNNIGIGASIAVNEVRRDTQALIGNSSNEPATDKPAGLDKTLSTLGDVQINADNSGFVGAYSLAAALVSGDDSTTDEPQQPPKKEGGDYGFGLSADISLNEINDTALAYIHDAVIAADDMTLTAMNHSQIQAIGGSAAIVTQDGTSAGLAGSWTQNTINSTTRAFVDNSNLTLTGNLFLTALSDNDILSINASGAIATSETGYSLAGQVTINEISSTTEAAISNQSDVISVNDLKLKAMDSSDIFSIAGALAYGGKAGIGTAISLNKIPDGALPNVISALIEDSDVSASGVIELDAESNSTIKAIAAAIGASKETMAAAITVATNAILSRTSAEVRGRKTQGIQANGKISLDASDTSSILVIAGGIGVTKGDAGFGAAVADNDISSTTLASIDNTILTSQNNIELTATSAATIHAIAAGGAGAENFALGGSVTTNTINSTTEALINASNVDAAGTLNLTASDTSRIRSDAGNASVAIGSSDPAVAVGASIAINDINNSVRAAMQNASTVSASQAVVSATAMPTIEALTLAGSVGIGSSAFGGAGSGSGNDIISTVEALISDSTVTTTGALSLIATDASAITADAGSAALTIASGGDSSALASIAVAAAAATNDIVNDTRAGIRNSSVNAGGDITLDASSTASIDTFTLGIAGALSAGSSGNFALAGAGSGSSNTVMNTIEAVVQGSTLNSGGALNLTATDDSVIIAEAGLAAISLAVGSGTNVGVGLGISLTLNDIDNSTRVLIDDSAVSVGGPVTLRADSNADIDALAFGVALNVAAGDGSSVSFNGVGAATDNNINNLVEAVIRDSDSLDSESVQAGGTISLTASDDSSITADAVAATLGVSVSGNSGGGGSVGVGVSLNNITNQTRATIEGVDVTSSLGDVLLDAGSTSDIDALAVAASVGFSGSGSSAVDLTADVSYAENYIANTVEAVIFEGSDVNAAGAVNLSATDATIITADIVSAAVSLAFGSSTSGGLAVAGTIAFNDIDNVTRAVIDGSTINAGTMLNANALSSTLIDATGVAASAQISGSGSLALSGAGTGADVDNSIANTIQAGVIGGSQVTTGTGVILSATDDATILADVVAASASVAVGSSGALSVGVAISLADNMIDNTTQALIDDSSVLTGGTLDINALSTADIDANGVAAALSVAGDGSLAIGASITVAETSNTALGTVEAVIRNNDVADAQQVATGGDVILQASNQSSITANTFAGSLAVSGSGSLSVSAAVAASLAKNTLDTDVTAGIENSSLLTGGAVDIDAISFTTIDAATIAVAASITGSGSIAGAVSGTGARATNITTGKTQALISAGSRVEAGGPVSLDANDTSSINADVIAASVSIGGSGSAALSMSISVTLAENQIGGSTAALIDNSTVLSDSSLSLNALGDTKIKALGVAASASFAGSGTFSLAGDGSGAVVTNTTSNSVNATITNGSLVDTTGTISLSAMDTSSITSDVVSASASIAASGNAALTFTVAVTLAENVIGGSTAALIDNSTVLTDSTLNLSALGDLAIDALGVAATASIAGSGAFSLGGAGSGAVVRNTTTNVVNASIRNASQVDASGAINLTATDTSLITSDVVSASASVAASGSAAVTFNVAIALAENVLGGNTTAIIEGSTVDTDNTLSLITLGDSTINSVGVAAAASIAGSGGFSMSGTGTGVVVSNVMNNTVESLISGGSDVNVLGDINLMATDQSIIDATVVAASVGISASGGASVGLSIAVSIADNEYGTTVSAGVDNAIVESTSGSINLSALSDASVESLSVGIAATAGGSGGFTLNLSGAGAIASTTSTNLTEAYIANDSVVIATLGEVTLSATDDTYINTDVIAVGFSASGSGGFSADIALVAGIAWNDVQSITRAQIDDSTVIAGTTLDVMANATTEVNVSGTGISLAVSGGTVAANAAVSAANVENTINSTVEALITNSDALEGQSVSSTGGIILSATDNLSVSADANAAAISVSGGVVSGSVSVASARALNSNKGLTRAGIDNSLVDANGGDVDVLATSLSSLTATPDAIAAAGAFSIGLAASGSGAEAINTSNSTIEAFIRNGADVEAGGAVNVEALDNSDATANILSVSLAIGLTGAAFGVGLADNTLSNTTTAFIDNASATAQGGDIYIDADVIQTIDTTATVLGVSLAIGVAGVGADANTMIDSTVEAYAHDATLTAIGSNVLIDADSMHTANTVAQGGAVGLAAVSAMFADATIAGATRAYADGELTVVSNGLLISADSIANALPDATSVAIGIVGGAGASVDATVNRTTEAYLGTRAGQTPVAQTNLSAMNSDVLIAATSIFHADASPLSLGIGAESVALAVTNATISGTTLAYVGEAATVNAGELDVLASSTETAVADTIVLAVGLNAGVAAASSDAVIDSDVEAWIGTRHGNAPLAGSSVNVTASGSGDGSVLVDATASRTAEADASGLAGSFTVVSVAVMLPSASVGGVTRSMINGPVTVNADVLEVSAQGENVADASALVGSISVAGAGGAGANVIAEVMDSADIEALVGEDVSISTSGTVLIDARTGISGNKAKAEALGGAGGLIGGAAVMLADARVAGGVMAAFDGDLLSASSLTVQADGKNFADSDTLAVSMGIGFGASGSGAIAEVAETADIEAYIGNTATISTNGALLVKAKGDNDATADSDAGSGGIVAITGSALSAKVSGGVKAALDGDVANASSVSVEATGNNNADAEALAISIGLFTGAVIAPSAQITDYADVEAFISSDAVLTVSTGTVQVLANNTNTATAVSTGASASIVGIQVMDVSASIAGSTRAYIEDGANIISGSVIVNANAITTPTASVSSTGISLVSGASASSTATDNHLVEAFIGPVTGSKAANPDSPARVTTTAGGSVNLGANLLSTVSSTTNMLGIGLGGSGAIANTFATATPTVRAYLGDEAEIISSGNINLTANANIDVDAVGNGTSLNLFGGFSGSRVTATTTPRIQAFTESNGNLNANNVNFNAIATVTDDAVVTLTSGGLFAGAGSSIASTTSTPILKAGIGSGTEVDVSGNVQISTTSTNSATSRASGTGASLVSGKGSAKAYATAITTSTAYLEGAVGDANNSGAANLTVRAKATDNANAHAQAVSGGLLSDAGAYASADAAPFIKAYISSPDVINVSSTTDIMGLALGNSTANAYGAGGGVVDVGTSQSLAKWRPTIEVFIGGSTVLASGHDIKLQAFNNHNESGILQSTNRSRATATATGGGLVSDKGADASTETDANISAHIGTGAELNAGNDLNIISKSRNRTEVSATGSSGGFVSNGSTVANATMRNDSVAIIDDSLSTGPHTRLSAANNIIIYSESDNVADVDAVGGAGGLLAEGGAEAKVHLISPVTKSRLGNYAVVNAPDAIVDISAINKAWLSAVSTQTTTGAIANNDAQAISKILNGQTLAEVGLGVDVDVLEFSLFAHDQRVYAEALSTANVPFNVSGTNRATSVVEVNLNPDAHIYGGGTDIAAEDKLTIKARADDIRTRAEAFTKTTGVTGNLHSIVRNDKIVDVDVLVDTNVFITTTDLIVEAYMDREDNTIDYNKKSTAEAQTAVNYVLTAVGTVTNTVCRVVGEVICLFGLLCDPKTVCDTITETIYDWVAEVLQSDVTTDSYGVENVTNDITFNADVAIQGGADPRLVVDSSGNIVVEDNINATVYADQIIVDDILNQGKAGSIVMRSAGGTTRGHSNVAFNTAFNSVTIINESSKDLIINDIEVFNTVNPPTITEQSIHGQGYWNYDLTTNADGTVFELVNDSASDSDIILQGHIVNPIGITNISNIGGGGGDILASSADAWINTRSISLVADSGYVGTDINRINLRVPVSGVGGTLTGSIDDAYGEQGLYLDVTAVSEKQEPIAVYIGADNPDDFGSGSGDVDIKINDSLYSQTDPVSSAYFIKNISAGGDITINAGSSNLVDTELKLAGTLSATSGLASINTISGSILGVSADNLISAHNIYLSSARGNVGTASNGIKTDLRGGKIDINSRDDVFVTEIAGDMSIGHVVASDGIVTLIADASILDTNDSGGNDIDATAAVLIAGADFSSVGTIGNIGGVLNPLETALDNLEAKANNGGLWLDNTGNLTIGEIGALTGVTAATTIDISAASSINVTESIVSTDGPVSLDATNNILVNAAITSGGSVDMDAGSDIAVHAAVTSLGRQGYVAGRDILIDAGITSGGGAVNILAGEDIMFTSFGYIDNQIGDASVVMRSAASIEMQDGSYIDTTDGAIDVDAVGNVIISLLSTTGAVTIDSSQGSILDTVDGNGNDIDAATAILNAAAGIGTATNHLETTLDNLEAYSGSGGMWLDNSGDLTIGEISNIIGLSGAGPIVITTIGQITVNEDVISSGDIILTASDSSSTGDNLIVDILHDQRKLSGNNVILRAGDDLSIAAGNLIEATSQIVILGDYGNVDSGVGSSIIINGDLSAPDVTIQGEADNDVIKLNGNVDAVDVFIFGEAGDDDITLNVESLIGHTRILGGSGEDLITINQLPTLTTEHNGTRDSVDLDGEEGSDRYIVNIAGSGDYRINVFDTGIIGTDDLQIYGTTLVDDFLLRASSHNYPDGVAFVAALHGDPVAEIERINYNKNLESLLVDARDGDDNITLDDNRAMSTLRGGLGNDRFQIGQVFKTPRDVNSGVAPEDEFETVHSTRGYLSNGVSYETTIDGEAGNDEFSVFRNTATLHLNGGDNNDRFIFRAFTEVGDGGADVTKYLMNAPVNITGGNGEDTLGVIGSEFIDNYVVTSTGILGVGLTVNYSEVETMEVDGAEGDDEFYVLSTSADVNTFLYGGLGSDRFSISGDTEEVTSGDGTLSAEAGSHTVDVIAGTLTIEGGSGDGSVIGIDDPIMLPGESNRLISQGGVLDYIGSGTDGQVDLMTVLTADLLAVITDLGLDNLADLVGMTLEISAGKGLSRFWTITHLEEDPISGNTHLSLQNPDKANSAWDLPTSESEYVINSLSGNFFTSENEHTDLLMVFNDGSGANDFGALDESRLQWTGMAGINYGNLEILEVLLGTGNDLFVINNTSDNTITAVHGGGGADNIVVNDSGGSVSPLMIFGDTTHDGSRYSGTPDMIQSWVGYSFNNPGNDRIDASASSQSVSIYGGAGNDIIYGSQAGDHLAGGSGNDEIHGQAGVDHMYGDSGFNADLSTRIDLATQVLTMVTTETAGNDLMYGNAGDDIMFGDHGIITQTSGTLRILTTDNVEHIKTVNPSNGTDDIIFAGNGRDVVMGGAGSDRIDTGADNSADIVLGDHGRATFNGSEVMTAEETTSVLSFNFGADDEKHEYHDHYNGITGIAGAVPADNWNNLDDDDHSIYGNEADETVLFDDGSLAQGISIEWGADLDSHKPRDLSDDNHSQIKAGDDQDMRLFDSYLYTSTKRTLGVDINGLSAHFQRYDVYVYVDADNSHSNKGSSTTSLSDGSTTYYLDDADGNTFTGTYVEVDSTDPNAAQTGNYVVFRGLTSDTFSLRVDDVKEKGKHKGSNKPAISGIQIVGEHHPIDRIETLNPEFGGDDIITTGGGADLVFGGSGNDTITTYGDALNAATDADIVIGDNGSATLVAGTVTELHTTDDSFAGNDTIQTGLGDDIVLGGSGSDVINTTELDITVDTTTQPDHDIVIGDEGEIRFFQGDVYHLTSTHPLQVEAGIDADTIYTGAGDDLLIGGNGNDYLDGGAGNDILLGDNAAVSIALTPVEVDDKHDRCDDDDDHKWHHGHHDDDNSISISLLSPTIGGDDTLVGGTGDDLLYGQFGNDTYVFAGGALGHDRLFETGEPRHGDDDHYHDYDEDKKHDKHDHPYIGVNDLHDRIIFSDFDSAIKFDLGKTRDQTVNYPKHRENSANTIITLSSTTGFEDVIGSAFDDKITGNDRDNTLEGLAGNDKLYGDKGDDILYGGDGDDKLYGGKGDDQLYGEAGYDKLKGGSGTDLLDGGADQVKPDRDKGDDKHDDGHKDGLSGDGWFVDTREYDIDTSREMMDALLVTGERYVFSEAVMADREAEQAHARAKTALTEWDNGTERENRTAQGISIPGAASSWHKSFVNELAKEGHDNPNARISIDFTSKEERPTKKGKRK